MKRTKHNNKTKLRDYNEDIACWKARTFPNEETNPILIVGHLPSNFRKLPFTLEFVLNQTGQPKDYFGKAKIKPESKHDKTRHTTEIEYITQNFFYRHLAQDTTFILSDTNVGREFFDHHIGINIPDQQLGLRAITTIGHNGFFIAFKYRVLGIPYDLREAGFFMDVYDSSGNDFSRDPSARPPFYHGDVVDPNGTKFMGCLENAPRILENTELTKEEKSFIASMILGGVETMCGNGCCDNWSPKHFHDLSAINCRIFRQESCSEDSGTYAKRAREETTSKILIDDINFQQLSEARRQYIKLAKIKEELVQIANEP